MMRELDEIHDKNRDIEQLITEKNSAYAERNKVVAAFAHFLHSLGLNEVIAGISEHEDKPGEAWESDWRTLLVIYSPYVGVMSWHFHDSEKHLLDGLPWVPEVRYDGHTTEEKYERLQKFSKEMELAVGVELLPQ